MFGDDLVGGLVDLEYGHSSVDLLCVGLLDLLGVGLQELVDNAVDFGRSLCLGEFLDFRRGLGESGLEFSLAVTVQLAGLLDDAVDDFVVDSVGELFNHVLHCLVPFFFNGYTFVLFDGTKIRSLSEPVQGGRKLYESRRDFMDGERGTEGF